MPKRTMTEEQFADEYTSILALETFKLLDFKKGGGADKLEPMFLSKLIGAYVSRALHSPPEHPLDKEELYEFTRDNFVDVKQRVQEAVSIGFQAALGTFSGKQVEYYCEIKPVPKSSNKQPC